MLKDAKYIYAIFTHRLDNKEDDFTKLMRTFKSRGCRMMFYYMHSAGYTNAMDFASKYIVK